MKTKLLYQQESLMFGNKSNKVSNGVPYFTAMLLKVQITYSKSIRYMIFTVQQALFRSVIHC